MASGVTVSTEAIGLYSEMKMNTSGEDRIRVATLAIKKGEVVVEKIYREKDLQADLCLHSKDGFDMFTDMMEEKVCRYILYDCHYETYDSQKEDIVFILWCADDASIKEKMKYASSKQCVKKAFQGVKGDVTLNDNDCKRKDNFAETVLRKKVKSIEGKKVSD